jgi:SpoVK/Ycf46/Vps4 family AAA+-type ATPase
LKRVGFWFKNKDWFIDRGMTWKMGALLYGPPGAGKTTTVRTIAQELDLPVYVFDLTVMSNEDFMQAWNDSRHDKPRIVLFEDFDTVFHGRKNISRGGVDLGCILNAIDGVEPEHGLLLFITTNQVKYIDDAIGKPRKDDPTKSTRPSRIDLVLKMDKLNLEGRKKIASRILRDYPNIADDLVKEFPNEPPAQFQDRCLTKALELKHLDIDGEEGYKGDSDE